MHQALRSISCRQVLLAWARVFNYTFRDAGARPCRRHCLRSRTRQSVVPPNCYGELGAAQGCGRRAGVRHSTRETAQRCRARWARGAGAYAYPFPDRCEHYAKRFAQRRSQAARARVLTLARRVHSDFLCRSLGRQTIETSADRASEAPITRPLDALEAHIHCLPWSYR